MMTSSHKALRRCICAGFAVGLFLVLQGCGGSTAMQEIESKDNMKILGMAIIQYKGDEGQWPDSLDQVEEQAKKVAADMGSDKDFATLMTNPITGDNPGYQYVVPAEGDPIEETVMLYQLRGGERDETLAKCYQSGSVR
jgi:hypothetical protein